jgi:hypothetical protein
MRKRHKIRTGVSANTDFMKQNRLQQKFAAKMKENNMADKKQVWGMLAVILAFTVVIAACSQDGDDGEKPDPKKIIITEISPEITGMAVIDIMNSSGITITGGGDIIANNSVTVPLKTLNEEKIPTDNDWTGTGSFLIFLGITENGSEWATYLYTNGQTLEQLEVTSLEEIGKIPLYSITSAVSTIPFDKFEIVPDELLPEEPPSEEP